MQKIKMCLIYLKNSDVISDIKALKEETITGKDFEDQAISTLALLHYWLRYWSKTLLRLSHHANSYCRKKYKLYTICNSLLNDCYCQKPGSMSYLTCTRELFYNRKDRMHI